MVNPLQYPYEIFELVSITGSTDANGHWIPGSESWVLLGKCRNEPNSKGQYRPLADGGSFTYEYLILMPPKNGIPAIGAKIEVRSGSFVRVNAEVKQIDPSNFHTRLWV